MSEGAVAVPASSAAGPIRRIFVAFDGSEKDAPALRWALRLGAPLGASVEVVHALGLRESANRTPGVDRESAHDKAVRETETVLRRTIDACTAEYVAVAACEVHLRILSGHPALVLLGAIDDERPDLVVVGRRPTETTSTLAVLGSVSRELASRSAVPVTVVPQG